MQCLQYLYPCNHRGSLSFFSSGTVFLCVYICTYMSHLINLYLHQLTHSSAFCVLAILDNTAVNIEVKIVLPYLVFISFDYINQSRVAGSYMVALLLIFRSLNTVVCSDYKFTFPSTIDNCFLYS